MVRFLLAFAALALGIFGCDDSDRARTGDASQPVHPSHAGGGSTYDAAASGTDAAGITDAGVMIMDASSPSAAGSGGSMNSAAGSGGAMNSAAGSGGAMNSDRDAAPPEPTVPPLEPLADCIPSGVTFATPEPAHGGDIALMFSAWLQPRATSERVEIRVLTAAGDVDVGYHGNLVWNLPAGAELVSMTPVVAGLAEATFRFQNTGNVHVSAALDNDPRSGYRDLIVYTPQLPIWELEVNPSDFERIMSNPRSREQIQGMLVLQGVPHATVLRLQGASSRSFPKKSFRFDLSDIGPVSGSYGKKLVLRAEYADKSLLRNWLALRMFRVHTRIPTPRSQLVHLRINGRYFGVMHNVERVAHNMLEYWGLSTDGSLYESDPESALSSPGGNLTPITPPENYPRVYAHQAGTIDYTDLRKFIEETLTLPSDKFGQVIEQELMVDDYIDYLAMMAAIQNHDHVRKNFYVYRDPRLARGWHVLPWDLDLSFGHLWSEANDVLDDAITADADIFVGVHVPERGDFYNQLIERVLTVPSYRVRFRKRVASLLSSGLTRAAAEAMLANAVCRATPDIVADAQKRATNAEYERRVAEIGAFIAARTDYVRSLQ